MQQVVLLRYAVVVLGGLAGLAALALLAALNCLNSIYVIVYANLTFIQYIYSI